MPELASAACWRQSDPRAGAISFYSLRTDRAVNTHCKVEDPEDRLAMPLDLQKARDLFLHAVGNLPPERWEEYAAEGCGGDIELQRQVSHLLQVHREAGSFLESPAVDFGDTRENRTSAERPTGNSQDPTIAQPGTVIGPYKLLQPIGEGGMGTVYMAEQTQPVRRTVALKLIKAGMDSRQVLARFGAERQAWP